MGTWRGDATGKADGAARALGLSETGAIVGSSSSSSKSDVLEPEEMWILSSLKTKDASECDLDREPVGPGFG